MKASIRRMYINAVNESCALRDAIDNAVNEFYSKRRCMDRNEQILLLDRISNKYDISMRAMLSRVNII